MTTGTIYTGIGSVKEQLQASIEDLKAEKILFVTDQGLLKVGLADQVLKIAEKAGKVEVFSDIESDPSIQTAEKCLSLIREGNFDVVVGLGGGSVIDISKVSATVANCPGNIRDYVGVNKIPQASVPLIIIPTTSGTGSEVTDRSILTDKEDMSKKGVVSPYMIPDIAIIDPLMIKSLPPFITAYTGMDALTHLIEAYVATGSSELTDSIALEGIKLVGKSLRKAVGQGGDVQARYEMAMASLLGGMAFNNAGLGIVHALALPLGAHYKVSHGVACSLMLPFVMEFNCVSDISKFAKVAQALGEKVENLSEREAARKAFTAVKQLASDIKIPGTLKEVGVEKTKIDVLAEEAYGIRRLVETNPRDVSVEDMKEILNIAFVGYN